MLKSELEKAAREYARAVSADVVYADGVEGSEAFEAGAKWALEWVSREWRKTQTTDEFTAKLRLQDETETKEK